MASDKSTHAVRKHCATVIMFVSRGESVSAVEQTNGMLMPLRRKRVACLYAFQRGKYVAH
ncbi:hypothetical protein M514_10843 [Trichuris suis]|uniref:Uncharacterized protein n=1 Tax=Trichuris suis TaxID=68888 RepID=A0A085LTH0_9BILA|nr:hypothetical protein M513_10843 [Trichuris suis]KFD63281.1 hypothetical protein M514_10843 [Trichuris suis]